jgi:hypothetical protein
LRLEEPQFILSPFPFCSTWYIGISVQVSRLSLYIIWIKWMLGSRPHSKLS